MADAADLKSVVRKDVRVRLPPSAPSYQSLTKTHRFYPNFRHGVKSVAELSSIEFIEDIVD